MKVKNVITLLFIAFTIVQCKNKESVSIKLNIDKHQEQLALVKFEDKDFGFHLDSLGQGNLILTDIKSPKFIKFYYDGYPVTLFVEPGNEVVLNFSPKSWVKKGISFEGDNVPVQEYLLHRRLKMVPYNWMITEQELFKSCEEVIQDNVADLNNAGLKEGFVQLEKERLKYATLIKVKSYYKVHLSENLFKGYEFSPFFFDQLDKYFVDDETLLSLEEYKTFLNSALYIRIAGKRDVYDHKEITEGVQKYILSKFKNPAIKEYSLHQYTMNYIEQYGIDDAHAIIKTYESNVQSSDILAEFNELLTKKRSIAIGQPSPSSKFLDREGNEVSLEAFKGKYVYIDCWATWCGPCCQEIPALQALEKEFHNNEIYFVSISLDKNKDKWIEKIEKDQLGGVQLIVGNDRSFLEAYSIKTIPRFILLDKEGRIINSNYRRPSDPLIGSELNDLTEI